MQMETSDNFQKFELKKKRKEMKKITAIEKNHEIIKKRHKKVKLKTNKGLQEGIFIFYFFNFCY